MVKNDFLAETAENFEQKYLCVLVLDVSGSMGGKPIDELNKGLQDFYNEISSDITTSQRLEVSLVIFNRIVRTLQEPALVIILLCRHLLRVVLQRWSMQSMRQLIK